VITKFGCCPQVMLIVSFNWFRLLPTLLSKTAPVKFFFPFGWIFLSVVTVELESEF
jgi:hypothetical protein